MPAVLKIDRRRRIVSSTFLGLLTAEELLRHQQAIIADPDFQPIFADFVDLSAVTDIDEKAVHMLAGSKSVFDPAAPHVVIVPAELPHAKALQYRHMVRVSRPNLHVVRTLPEARALLHGLGYRL